MMRNIPDFHFLDLGVAALGRHAISIYNSSSPEQVVVPGRATARRSSRSSRTTASRSGSSRCARSSPSLGDDREPQPRRRASSRCSTAAPSTSPRCRRACTPGHARHGDLHVGHHRSAEGRDDLATATSCGPPRATCGCSTWSRSGFRAVSYLPMAHIAERMSTHYLAVMGGYEVTDCPDPGRSPPTRARSARRSCSACRGCGRRSTPACRPPSAPTRRRRPSSTRRSRPPSRSRSDAPSAPPPPRTTPPTQFLDEVAFAGVRALVGLDAVEFAITGAAPIPAELHQLVPRHRRAAVGDLRHVREHRAR